MKQLTQAYKKLDAQHSKYMDAKGRLEKELFDKIEFEFSVEYLEGDGFLILNIETTAVSPVEDCIEHIKKYGKLTEGDHKCYSI